MERRGFLTGILGLPVLSAVPQKKRYPKPMPHQKCMCVGDQVALMDIDTAATLLGTQAALHLDRSLLESLRGQA